MVDAVIRLRLDSGNVVQASGQAAQAIGKIGQVGEISARQTAAAMRQLPAQFTDVATQLAGGQNPLLILLQQGGQIKDSFGGIGPAIRGIGAAINPVTAAVGAFAAAAGLLATGAYQGWKESAKLRDTLVLTGNAAGLTADRVQGLAERVAGASQQTVGSAREIALALAATGRTSAGVIESQAKAAARIADLSGESATKIASTFASQLKEPAKFAAALNESYNFLTVAQFKRIQQLEREGKATEAAVMTNELLTKRLEGQRQQLGYLEQGLDFASKKWSEFWAAVKGVGAPETTIQRIEAIRKELADRTQRGPLNGTTVEAFEKGNARLRARIQLLAEEAKQERSAAEAASDAAQKNRTGIAGALETPRAEFGAIRTAQEQYRRDFLQSEKGYYDELDAMRKRDVEKAYERSLTIRDMLRKESQEQKDINSAAQRQQDEFLQEMRDAVTRAGLEQITDERQRGEALIALDLVIANRRLKAKGLGGSTTEEAQRLLNEKAAYDIRALSKQTGDTTYDDVKGALSAAFRDSNNPAKAFASALGNAIFTRVTSRLADALATAAVGRDGQGGAWGDLLSYVGSVVGGGISVDTTGVGTNNTGGSLPTRGGMATGTNYVPRDMLALVHRGEAIVPARYNHGAGGGGRTEVHYHVPAGQSPAAYAAALEENNRRLEAKLAADLARPGRTMNSAMLAGA